MSECDCGNCNVDCGDCGNCDCDCSCNEGNWVDCSHLCLYCCPINSSKPDRQQNTLQEHGVNYTPVVAQPVRSTPQYRSDAEILEITELMATTTPPYRETDARSSLPPTYEEATKDAGRG
ncbi:hypothetical protein FQA39_LY03399 [Lamprigera yunnana]|nr:hypothetical protein FQA39_LY03399 [Lamprigera yunnana]